MTVSRNTPCPCGSGLKYKRCHGRKSAETPPSSDAVWRRLRALLDDLPTRILRFARKAYGPGVLDEAWAEFTLWGEEEPRFDPETMHMQVFMPWFFHRWSPDPTETRVRDSSLHERPPSEALLEREGGRLDPLLRRYLEACLRSPFTFHEIVRVDPGRGFRSRDVLTGNEHDVLERAASRSMQPGDILFGQLVTVDGITVMEACSPHAFPPEGKLDLIDFRKRLAAGPVPLDGEALRESDLEIREMYLVGIDALLNPRLPRLRNTDGDPILFHRISFAIGSADEAFHALEHLAPGQTDEERFDSVEFDGEGRVRAASFAWTVAGNAVHRSWDNTVLGHLEIDDASLVATVNSAERAERITELVLTACPGARHLGTKVETVEDAQLAEADHEMNAGPDDDPAATDPAVRAHLAQMTARHYQDWVRASLPALGGRTPLEAIGDPEGREKVEALVRQIERHGKAQDPPMDPSVTRRLRADLGLGGEEPGE